MKKTKLLKPMLAFVSLGVISSVVPSIASCSCKNNNEYIEAGAIEGSIIGNNMATYLTYSLRSKLSSGETITIEHGDTGSFTFAQPTVAGKVVTVPVYWLKTDENEKVEWTGDITFNCMKGDKKVWSQVVKGTKVTYLPYCTLISERAILVTDEYKTSPTEMYAEFKFSIPSGLPDKKTYLPKLKVIINEVGYADNQLKVNVDAVQISEFDDTAKTFTVTVPVTTKDQTSIGEGYQLSFDIQVYCMYGDTDIPIWISNNFKKLSMTYSSNSIAIPNDCLDLEQVTEPGYEDFTILKGVRTDVTIPQNANTLLLPQNCITIGNNGQKIHDLPNTITKIVAPKNSYLTNIRTNAFNGCNHIKYVDFSNIPNDTPDLETLNFETNAFSGWADAGTIIWGTEFSQYKRHLIMNKFYNAGLTQNAWFNITEVHNESELREACKVGANIKLKNNIIISDKGNYTGQINIEENLAIDLNGFKVTSDAPICNWERKEFAIFGIWKEAQVILTDTSENHSGSIEAFNNEGLKTTKMPTSTDPEDENELWDWKIDENRWQPRECRCFYIRTDTPTRAQPSLWILAGHLKGCCTTIMNWNGACWIQADYKNPDMSDSWAPSFNLWTPFSNYTGETRTESKEFCRELLNCDDQKYATGDAYFEVYGGVFYGYKAEWADNFHFYDPANPPADTGKDWLPEGFEIDKSHESDTKPYWAVRKAS